MLLRIREPAMPRPFRVPGGTVAMVALGTGPTLLIVFALWAARDERLAGLPALLFAAIVAALGPLAYALTRLRRTARHGTPPSA